MQKRYKLMLAFCLMLAVLVFLHKQQPMHSQEETKPTKERDLAGKIAKSPIAAGDRSPAEASSGKASLSWDHLARESQGRWSVTRDRFGFVKRMTGAILPLESMAPVMAAQNFLDLYGEFVIGINQNNLTEAESRQEEQVTQVLYSQTANDLPVFGSRISMFIDRSGNLVHFDSTVHHGSFPSSTPSITAEGAAAIVRDSLQRSFEKKNPDALQGLPETKQLAATAVLGYHLVGEVVTLVYRLEFSLEAPKQSDYEAIVDARDGSLAVLRPLSKK